MSWSCGVEPRQAEIVVQQLQLDGGPKPGPRAGEDPVNEARPQSAERRFDSLPPAAGQRPLPPVVGHRRLAQR